jgi:DNA helicase-2/ATP-dependent DNA helicase PcrA
MQSDQPNCLLSPTRPIVAADAYLGALNPQQRHAVEFGVGAGGPAGPLLVIAGAGSGKTDTIAHRVAHLVICGADPHRLLLLTFSRRAAAEMERRAGRILHRSLAVNSGAGIPSLPWAGTFHGIGARLLRSYAERIGLHASFTIHDRSDSEDLLAIARHVLGFSNTRNRFPTKTTCLAIYSRIVNSEASLDQVLEKNFPWCAQWKAELKELFHAYVAAKQAQNILDYDDLLLYWSQTMTEPALAAEIGARFDHVLVDEYQDTNRLQSSILRALKPDGRGLTVVGDDAQSIYSFRAATIRNILDFPTQFTAPAEVVTLERNYRSTQPILDASNAVIGLAAERYTKNLWTDRGGAGKPQLVAVRDGVDQARCVADGVLAYREAGIALRSQAVLFRTSSHSAQLELELARRDIPFVKFGGLRFLEAAHIKDVLSVLRWADNPRNRLAGFRVARLLPGVGPVAATRLLDAMDEAPDPLSAMAAFDAPAASRADCQALHELFAQLRRSQSPWPTEMEQVIAWYEPHLQRIYDDEHMRRADLAQLQQIAVTYRSRERFLTEVTLDPPSATSAEADAPGLDDDYLVLSTIHSAKGQEWNTVHVLNVVDGCIPSDMSTGTTAEVEEERRLLYVAMTRAKNHLHLMVPQRFHVTQQSVHGDRHVYASRSRFLPNSICKYFQFTAWPVAEQSDGTGRGASVSAPSVDISSRIREFWR